MSTDPEPARILGLTEQQWRACADPLRLPKLYRGRATPRQFCLLGCAYLLDGPGAFRNGEARRVVSAVRAAALSAEGRSAQAATSEAVRRLGPDYVGRSGFDLFPRLDRRPDLGQDGGRLAYFLGDFALHSPGTGDVNCVAVACVTTVRNEATNTVRPVLQALIERHGRRPTPEFKEAVFALIPEPEQTAARNGRWDASLIPDRVRNRVYAAAYRGPVAAANARLVALIREVLGNPFRPPAVLPEWREADFGAARRIAEEATATGDYSQVPILADALEDAGCRDEELLAHCRDPHAAHVPGCWAVDAVLGKS